MALYKLNIDNYNKWKKSTEIFKYSICVFCTYVYIIIVTLISLRIIYLNDNTDTVPTTTTSSNSNLSYIISSTPYYLNTSMNYNLSLFNDSSRTSNDSMQIIRNKV